jgi:uncharacterized protein YlxP (DUF503 family)
MAYKTDIELKTQVDAVIKVNGNREITPPLDNSIRTNFIDSKVNLAGGNVMLNLLGATAELTASDPKSFLQLHQVVDLISDSLYDDTLVFLTDGTKLMDDSAPVAWATGSAVVDNAGVLSVAALGNLNLESTTGVITANKDLSFLNDSQGVVWGTDYLKSVSTVLTLSTVASSSDIKLDSGNGIYLNSAVDIYLQPTSGVVKISSANTEYNDAYGSTWLGGSSVKEDNQVLKLFAQDTFEFTANSNYAYFTNTHANFSDTYGIEWIGGSYFKETSTNLDVVAQGTLNLGTATTTGRTGITTTILGSLAGDDVVKTVKVSLSSAEILALNATPKQLIAAPGSGKTIQVARIIGKLNFVSAAYATNTTLQVHFNNGGSVTVISNQSVLLTSTVNRMLHFIDATPTGATSLQYIENADLRLNVASGNPTTGGGSLDLYITYKIITL